MSVFRRLERFSLGLVFGFVAWIIERRVLKAIRLRGDAPPARGTLADETTSELAKPSA